MTAPTAIIRALPINKIAAPSNVRLSNGHDKESLSQLAESIKVHGLMQPIIVRANEEGEHEEFVIVVGRRRLAACKLAGMDAIPAIVSETDEAKSYELEIAENIQREQMTLADTARAVRTLMMIYNNAKTVGQIVNKSPAWVSKHLTITSSQFPVTIAELLDRDIVIDLETLLLLAQIAKLSATNEGTLAVFTKMLQIAHAGDMSRAVARDALAQLKSAGTSKQIDRDGDEAEDLTESNDAATSKAKLERFGKLELAREVALQILSALNYPKVHKPSSRPSEATIAHVDEFIRTTWGK